MPGLAFFVDRHRNARGTRSVCRARSARRGDALQRRRRVLRMRAAIAAIALGAVQRRIGLLQQVDRRIGGGRTDGNADADRDQAQRAGRVRNLPLLDGRQQPPRDRVQRRDHRRAGKHHAQQLQHRTVLRQQQRQQIAAGPQHLHPDHATQQPPRPVVHRRRTPQPTQHRQQRHRLHRQSALLRRRRSAAARVRDKRMREQHPDHDDGQVHVRSPSHAMLHCIGRCRCAVPALAAPTGRIGA